MPTRPPESARKTNDDIVVAELYEKYSEQLMSFFRRTSPEDSASDCVQECFLRVIEGLRNDTIKHFDFLDAYMYGVARRVRWNQLRQMSLDQVRRSNAAVEDLVSNVDDPSVGLTSERPWPLVEAALVKLPHRDEDLIRRRCQYEQDYDTISEHYGLNHGAIRTALSRALRRLRCLLEKETP